MTSFDEHNMIQTPNQTLNQILNLNPDKLLNTYDKYMYLKLYIDNSNNTNNSNMFCHNLKQKYINSALNHNNKILNPNNQYFDAGFDLFAPYQIICQNVSFPSKIDFNIICSAQMVTDTHKTYNTGYYMYPRSSISKTKLRLANATGIIDSGYRGHLIGMFDVVDMVELGVNEYIVESHDRLLQICAPGLVPIVVQIVDSMEELGNETERGAGGLGSSGR